MLLCVYECVYVCMYASSLFISFHTQLLRKSIKHIKVYIVVAATLEILLIFIMRWMCIKKYCVLELLLLLSGGYLFLRELVAFSSQSSLKLDFEIALQTLCYIPSVFSLTSKSHQQTQSGFFSGRHSIKL